MKNKLIKLLGLCLFVVFVSGCDIRHVAKGCDEVATIPIHIDWNVAEISPQNVTVLVYDANIGDLVLEHRFENNDDLVQSYINLPVGSYNVVVFNELREDLKNINIRKYDNYDLFEAYSIEEQKIRFRNVDYKYVKSPEIFASALVTDFTVTSDMVTKSISVKQNKEFINNNLILTTTDLMNIKPLRNICELRINMHIQKLSSALMPALVDIRNLTEGYYLSQMLNTMNFSTIQFLMGDRQYDEGSTQNGTISATFTSFGVVGRRMGLVQQPADRPLQFNMYFMLTDNTTVVNRIIDVDKVVFSQEDNGTIILQIDMAMCEPLPDSDSIIPPAINPEIIDWDIIDIPLISK